MTQLPVLARAYYHAAVHDFLSTTDEEVLGHLSRHSEQAIEQLQRNAWLEELGVLRSALRGLSGMLLLEYAIPRMGRRADAVLLLPRAVIVIEFKVGSETYDESALDQVSDYALDLKNFQKQSHDKGVVPLLVATDAPMQHLELKAYPDGLYAPVRANRSNMAGVLADIAAGVQGPAVDAVAWLASTYAPTPTIVEAAQALYQKHSIIEISRSEAGAENLTKTAEAIRQIVAEAQATRSKAVCFVTGVPGAGKTLAGLNIANAWHNPERGEHAVFLSGNGPLVAVLREALARDDVDSARSRGQRLSKSTAASRVKAFIQNVHHFRDDNLSTDAPPVDRIVVFDEAQRAWDMKQTEAFMRERHGIVGFGMSEPEFLLSVLNRHDGWATMICLIGGGQEINTGEAGLAEWFRVLRDAYKEWTVYVPGRVEDSEYSDMMAQEALGGIGGLERKDGLHLATSIRSFRAEHVSGFVKLLLDCDAGAARRMLPEVLRSYPIVLTRDIKQAKSWLREHARGTERFGVIASSEAQRLKPFAVNVKAPIDPINWFLNGKNDIRSSVFLEDVATEFQVQGLELDWTCVAWDGDLRYCGDGWQHYGFVGTRWQTMKDPQRRKYLKNAYRVLLTRARQGMVIFVPHGDDADSTRKQQFYDGTYGYLLGLGVPAL